MAGATDDTTASATADTTADTTDETTDAAIADTTLASLPTYAELTQTQAWAAGAPVPVAPREVTGTEPRAGRYEEGAVLGVGGMGKVVLARDHRIGRDVAVKVMHPDRELSPDERERFLREAQVQGQLEHPSIVPVYDIDRRPDGSTFFTMRRVNGRTLHAILEERRAGGTRYTQRELLQAFATVCLTMDYAHARGVVHRDLKPANIMLGDFGEVYVLDWGLARILAGATPAPASLTAPPTRLSMPGVMMGTPLYMAPEQMADPDVGPAADIYSLGALLFEILTLEHVRDPRALYAPVEARPSVRAPHREVAPELETICVRATQLLAEDRYPSARALQEAVARYLEGDRELEHRRALATVHAARARAALAQADEPTSDYETERGTAMRELVRALALEPTNREHVAMLAEIMERAPRTVPPEIAARLAGQSEEMIRRGARYTSLALLSWFAFLPVVLLAGLRRTDYAWLIGGAVAVTVALAFVTSRARPPRRTLQYVTMVAMILAGVGLSRVFGPLILMPTMLTTWAIVVQAHPDRQFRLYGLALAIAGLIVPVSLELLGVLPASYLFADGRLQVLPQMIELPAGLSLAFLTVANVGMAGMPAAFVGRLREQLAQAQRHQLVQTWHFRRLGDDLIRASAPRP